MRGEYHRLTIRNNQQVKAIAEAGQVARMDDGSGCGHAPIATNGRTIVAHFHKMFAEFCNWFQLRRNNKYP
jgi:hypothetical protein